VRSSHNCCPSTRSIGGAPSWVASLRASAEQVPVVINRALLPRPEAEFEQDLDRTLDDDVGHDDEVLGASTER